MIIFCAMDIVENSVLKMEVQRPELYNMNNEDCCRKDFIANSIYEVANNQKCPPSIYHSYTINKKEIN